MATGTLYAHRPVENGWDIIEWAKDQGIPTTLEPNDLHVTVIYSDTPFEWPGPDGQRLQIPSKRRGELREVRVLGEGALCLVFENPHLLARFDEMIEAGAVSKYGSYLAHVTISYNAEGIDPAGIEPYAGRIELGGEVYGEVDDDWKEHVVEKALHEVACVSDVVLALVEKYAGPVRAPAAPVRKAAPAKELPVENQESFEFHCRFAKADMDKGQAFGFFSVATVGKKMVVDGEKQKIPAVELEKAAYDHVMESRIADEEHDGSHKGVLIESMLFTPEKCAAMVKSLAEDGITAVIDIPCVAWWGGHQITDADVRKKVKSGEYKGFSIGGRAMLTPDPK